MSLPLFHIDYSLRSWFDRRLTGRLFMIPSGKNNEHGSTQDKKWKSQLMVLTTNKLSPQRLRRDFCRKERCMSWALFSICQAKVSLFHLFILFLHWTGIWPTRTRAALPKRERGLAHRQRALRQQGPWATFQVSRMPIQRDTGQSNSKWSKVF